MSLGAFFALALAVTVGRAVAGSPYASSSPDGLEKVAEEKGFIEDGKLHSIQDESPIPDYAFPGVDNPRVATGLAGFVGVIIVALVGVAIGRLFHRRRSPGSRDRGDPTPGTVT
jgi:hypothetical protein